MTANAMATATVALHDLDLDDVAGEYLSRDLARLSDARLIDAVATVLGRPRADPPDSFVLHAPLELLARAALLPRVSPTQRERARHLIVRIAAAFTAFGPPAEPADTTYPSTAAALEALVAALGAGDLNEAEAAGRHLGENLDADALTTAVADTLAPSLAAAAHGPIFLHHLPRAPRSPLAGAMFATLAREVARHPEWRLSWFDGGLHGEGDLVAALAATPVLGSPGSDFIQPLMEQAESSGLAASVVGGAVSDDTDLDDATRAILRVATASMLVDDPAHAPYGWSHCLTIPQGLLSAARASRHTPTMVALAATHVVGFRAGEGSAPLDTLVGDHGRIGADALLDRLEDASPEAVQGAIDHAATHEDAHLTKYVVSCLDAARTDPGGGAQHRRAAVYLSDWWRAAEG